MIAHLKTLAAALVTMLVGPPLAESVELSIETGEEQHQSGGTAFDEGETPNIMGDIV